MSQDWSVLRLHGVEDVPSLARKLLATLPDGDFRNHFIARRIKKIDLGRIISDAMLTQTPDKQGFNIVLLFNRKSSVEEWMISIGHELAHTFAYGIKLDSPLLLRWRTDYHVDEKEEEFCELFGAQWASLGDGHAALRHLLRTYLEKPGSLVLTGVGRRYTIFNLQSCFEA